MNDDIRAKKLIYYLTSLTNVQSILDNGLLPRVQLEGFVDVADPEIIESRKGLRLEHHVPFHFFARNPFDGRVQHDRPSQVFALIAVQREVARAKAWKVIPKHPLAGSDIELLEYDEGIDAIDWELMSKRDYSNQHCKCVCMAECLAPGPVSANLFHSIYVKDDEARTMLWAMLNGRYRTLHVDVAPAMFSK